ncbi:MAG: family 10 glycosylhydrolase [Deferribacteres bacterium]|nr:family 10 glycosylhydrolase [candidate division KSB1 bacterium]MCB9503853.1 family 10 glycosylhydrolase [Deferribacteres bacterium]
MKNKLKFWTWLIPDTKKPLEEWKRTFSKMKAAGIDAILPQIYQSRKALFRSDHLPMDDEWLERILPVAKAEGLEIHAWMWSMPCNIPKIEEDHPDWFCVNRNLQSVLVKPAYVPYYKFMCPSHPGVHEFVQKTVTELASFSDLDGIHLDYIRYPDVILPVGLQPKYGIVQDREFPEYDYCYCEACRGDFKKQTGIDAVELKDPSTNILWRQFRNDRITSLVNEKLVPIARKNKKQITAAVFPNRGNVRQQWQNWHLDAFLPMLYHKFYNAEIPWIQEQTRIGVKALTKQTPIFSGLFVPSLSPEELKVAMENALAGGAQGVSLFNADSMTDSHWKIFQNTVKSL